MDIRNSFLGALLSLSSQSGLAQDYIYVQDAPRIPEPMVFDMVRPLGAKKGELEANMLVQRNLSGPHRSVNGGPEVEYAIADGFALELELPVDDLHVAEYKLGVQGTFGTFAGGRAVHGVQYLGVYDRASPRWENSLTYLLGYRFDHRWSTMTMIGIGNVVGGRARGNLLFNHSTFYDISDATTLGFEINTHRGAGRYTLLMPQVHQALTGSLKLQAGLGVVRGRSAAWRPQVAFRLIREF